MTKTIEYWKSNYGRLTGAKQDYYLAIHPDKAGIINRFYHHQKMVSFNRLLNLVVSKKGMNILDFGCGTGIFSEQFDKIGANVIGVDVSQELVERNRSLIPTIDFRLTSGDTLDFPNNKFDLIHSMMVLQHIPGNIRCSIVKEFNRTLKPGGYVMIVESIYQADSSAHLFPISEHEWVSLFEKNGFRLIHHHGMEYVLLHRVFLTVHGGISQLVKILRNNVLRHVNASGDVTKVKDENDSSTSEINRMKKTLLEWIDTGIILLSYPLEPLCKIFLPKAFAIRGAFLLQKK
jgi:2-polyprenyl-3-methyl-5-hydroxy-6-metoxy-1,4-benzoquinol methylase